MAKTFWFVSDTLGSGDEQLGQILMRNFIYSLARGADRPARLMIPPSLWHGWVSNGDHTTLLCVGSEVYNRERPDEERIAWDSFGANLWEVKPR